MRITIESVRDPERGPCYYYHGDVDNEGHHSFAGTEDNLNAAFEAAKECIRIESQHWSIPVDIDAEPATDEATNHV